MTQMTDERFWAELWPPIMEFWRLRREPFDAALEAEVRAMLDSDFPLATIKAAIEAEHE